MQSQTKITLFCSIDERLLKDPIILSLLRKHSFRPTKANFRIFYSRVTKSSLTDIQKDLSVFYYEGGKLKRLLSNSFNSYYNGKGNFLDWQEHAEGRSGNVRRS